EWLAQHKSAKDLVSAKQGRALRDVLPRIGARDRQLILTWASDPQSVAAMARLLKSVLGPGASKRRPWTTRNRPPTPRSREHRSAARRCFTAAMTCSRSSSAT